LRDARGRRAPAVPFAIAFLAGIGLAGTSVPIESALPWTLAGLVCAQALVPRRCLLRAVLLLSVATAGSLHLRAARAEDQRSTAWLPRDGGSVALELLGTVDAAPERAPHGERALWVTAAPARMPDAARIRIALRVLASPAEPTERLDALRSGDTVRLFASLSTGRGVGLRTRGFEAAGSVKSARLVERVERGPLGARWVSMAKAEARRRLDEALGAKEAARAILGAMLLGDRLLVDRGEERLLRRSGLVHLLSVSGLHIALALAAAAFVIRRTGMGLAARVGVTLPVIAALAGFVGSDSPVERAALTAMVFLAGRFLGREGSPLNTLAIAAIVLGAAAPAATFGASFRLTFVATAGILLFAQPIARALPLWRPIAVSIGVSAAAYAASAPVAMLVFASAAPSAIVSNLAGAFLCAWLMAAGTALLALYRVPFVGAWLAAAVTSGTDALLYVAARCGELPLAFLRVAPPSQALLALYALLVLRLHTPLGGGDGNPTSIKRRVARRLTVAALALTLAAMHLGPPPPSTEEAITATVLDVGQGQAVLITGPNAGVLVDAGGTSGGRFDAGDRVVARALAQRGIRRLDALVVTHLHDDHAGGAEAILRDFEVDALWLPPGFASEPLGRALADLAREQHTALVLAEDGGGFSRGAMAVRVLHPRRRDFRRSDNDRSLVVRIAARGSALLIPGDVSTAAEAVLVARHVRELAADVLVLPHHGSKRSTSPVFLAAVAPRFAIASAGRFNRFGHPDPSVLARVTNAGAVTFRTDIDGTVRCRWPESGVGARTSPTGCGSGPE